MHYSFFERRLARILDGAPRLRQRVKHIYQYLNYVVASERSTAVLNPVCDLSPVVEVNDPCGSFFFGYYDKRPWSACGRYYLLHSQSRKCRQAVQLVCSDLDTKRFGSFARSSAWNFQQGSMLQWLPGQDDLVIFNDVEDRKLVAKVMNPFTGRNYRVLDAPVQSVSPDGRIALAINYKRLFRLRPEYGYAPDVENFAPDMELGEDGIWKMDLGSGRVELIISLHQLIAYRTRDDMAEAEHKVNHLVVSPSGDRFAFMHRWIGPKGKFSRLYTANCDGTELCLLADDRMVSHYAWKNRHQLLAWARKEPYGDHYFLFEDRSDRFEIIGEGMLDRFGDGHPSFSPDGRWIVTDTYPDRARMRSLLLFDTLGNRVILVGRFFAPWDFDGPTRCDLHPRWHPEGRSISVDSAHEGVRKSYIIDVEKVVKNGKT